MTVVNVGNRAAVPDAAVAVMSPELAEWVFVNCERDAYRNAWLLPVAGLSSDG